MTIQFFTTVGCHLCEQAAGLLAQLQHQTGSTFDIEVIDIADDDELIEQYGVRIPVIKNLGDPNDLGWPFSLEQLSTYIGSSLPDS